MELIRLGRTVKFEADRGFRLFSLGFRSKHPSSYDVHHRLSQQRMPFQDAYVADSEILVNTSTETVTSP
jgi:hypothetical protein